MKIRYYELNLKTSGAFKLRKFSYKKLKKKYRKFFLRNSTDLKNTKKLNFKQLRNFYYGFL